MDVPTCDTMCNANGDKCFKDCAFLPNAAQCMVCRMSNDGSLSSGSSDARVDTAFSILANCVCLPAGNVWHANFQLQKLAGFVCRAPYASRVGTVECVVILT